MEIIDHRMVGALHVDLAHRDLAATLEDGDSVFQTATLEAILDGAYEGDLTFGELLSHGDLGIGTVDHLDGEMVVVDGEAFVIRSSGRVDRVGADERTPFAVVCRFRPTVATPLGPLSDWSALTDAIDEAAGDHPVVAVRVDGRFDRVLVRSVARQDPPYPPLIEVTAHQREWELVDVEGSLVGFRFPDVTGGLEVPGWHLHFITGDRAAGGHVIDAALATGQLSLEVTDDVHVEVPAALGEVVLGADRTAEIAQAERGQNESDRLDSNRSGRMPGGPGR